MTRRQCRDLEPGDRVHCRGADPEDGVVLANNEAALLVAWDSGRRTSHHPREHDFIDLAPTTVDQITR